MKLYHYSNIDIKNKIKVKYCGQDFFTTDIKRAFFYTIPEPEQQLKNYKYLYVVNILPDKIYSLKSDLLELKNKYDSITKMLRAIIKKGYAGIVYNIGDYDIVNLFEDIKIDKKIPLTKD